MDLVAGRTFTTERQPLRHLDPVLLVVVLALSGVGCVLIYSATRNQLQSVGLDPGTDLKKQLAFLLLGLMLLMLTAAFDYRFLKVYAGFAYAATVAALVLVRTPIGSSALGAQRWFGFAGFQITPSEFTKVALILMLAAVLSEIRGVEPTLTDVFRSVGIAALPIGLVFIQPDIGTSIVLCVILGGMLVVAGTRFRYLIVLGLASLVLIFAALHLGVVKQYQIDRLTGFANQRKNSQTLNYNLQQAENAIGAGGITGSGYLNGRQTNLQFVPEQATDFIFTAAGEQFGFIGAMAILGLYALLLWRAIRISVLAKDPFGTYAAAGVAAMWAIQMFVNVGMVIGIMPITGIPLPLLSYGGSSLLTNMVGVGLLLNIHMRRYT